MSSYQNLLDKAIKIAVDAHSGQVDKAGKPYILHPLRLMINAKNPEEKITAVLHDVIEDSDLTIKDLYSFGFPNYILDAIELLTKENNDDYMEYIRRLALHPLAKEVKLLDLYDNSVKSRISNPTERDKQRWEKYDKAIRYLLLEAPLHTY